MDSEFEVGDVVFAAGDVAEVVEFKRSKYGYTSVTLRVLTRPPMPETPTDSLPCAFVGMIMPKRGVRAYLLKNKDKPETAPELQEGLKMLEQAPDEVLMEGFKATLIDLNKHGVLMPWLLKTGAIKRREDEEEE